MVRHDRKIEHRMDDEAATRCQTDTGILIVVLPVISLEDTVAQIEQSNAKAMQSIFVKAKEET
jgi:hypothetical protein